MKQGAAFVQTAASTQLLPALRSQVPVARGRQSTPVLKIRSCLLLKGMWASKYTKKKLVIRIKKGMCVFQ